MKWQFGYLAACAAVVFGSLAYFLCDFGAWPRLMYLPYEREWIVASALPSSSAMVYPGMLVWGAAGAFFGAAATLVVGIVRNRGGERPLRPATLHLWAAWSLTAFSFTALYFFWGLWPF